MKDKGILYAGYSLSDNVQIYISCSLHLFYIVKQQLGKLSPHQSTKKYSFSEVNLWLAQKASQSSLSSFTAEMNILVSLS